MTSRLRPFLEKKGLLVISLLLIFWALAVASRLLWNGDVYGLDFRVYHPDGACYSQFAFDMAGQSEAGTKEIIQTYSDIGSPIGSSLNETGDAVLECYGRGLDARVLYPAFSVPFVALIGLPGMLVVPALSWLCAILVPALLLLRRRYFLGAAIAGSLAIASGSLARWSVSNTVDPLLMGLVAFTLLFLPIFRPPRRSDLIGLAVLAILGSLVRQSFPIWVAIALGPWIVWMLMNRKMQIRHSVRRNPWSGPLAVLTGVAISSWYAVGAIWGSQNSAFVFETWKGAVTSSIGVALSTSEPTSTLPTQVTPGITETLPTQVTPGITDALSEIWTATTHAVNLGWQVIYTEIGQLVVIDRALLILLGLATFAVWKNRKWAAGYMFISVFAMTLAIGAINSTLGINFRFQMSTVPFAVLLAGLAISSSRKQRQETSEATKIDLGKITSKSPT